MKKAPFRSLGFRSKIIAQSLFLALIVSPVAILVGVSDGFGQDAKEVAAGGERKLFDGKSLDGWKKTNFGGEGDVEVVDGMIVLSPGNPLTGITFEGEVPKVNYELTLEAQRLQGIDFFCGLTFPVEDSHVSFIVAGWAGAVVGLSSIDGLDAARNDTTKYMKFDNNRWYTIKVRVTKNHIEAWIDKEKVVDKDVTGKKLSLRGEVLSSRPLGISAFESKAALRGITIKEIPVEEKK